MSDYVLGSDAVLDLEDISDYIAADNVAAAMVESRRAPVFENLLTKPNCESGR